MKKIELLVTVLFSMLFIGTNLWAQDFYEVPSEVAKEWETQEKVYQKEWETFKSGVEKKWNDSLFSTEKVWVSYDADKDVRSIVDFENGNIAFEVVISGDTTDTPEKVREKISKQAALIFNEEDFSEQKILENLVVNTKGYSISADNQKEYITKEIMPEVKPVSEPFVSKDGITRKTYTVRIDMVKGYSDILAKKYLPIVKKNAARFNLKPEFVLAIIRTESAFNPRAISHCNAVGLMQLVPTSGGHDAYRHIYGRKWIPTRKYLFDPEKNIELGCAYFDLLNTTFKNIKGEVKREYASICAYNCGPGCVKKRIATYPVSTMTDSELYNLLRKTVPNETKDYIKRVVKRIPYYSSLVGTSSPAISKTLWERLGKLADNAAYKVNISLNQKHFRIGDTLVVTCSLDKGGYINVLSVNPDDTKADILYPNQFHQDNYIGKGAITIPGPGDEFVIRCTPPHSRNSMVLLFHTKEKINAYKDGEGALDVLFKKMSEKSLKGFEVQSNNGVLGAGKVITSVIQ